MAERRVEAVAEGLLSVREAADFSRLSRAELYVMMGRGELLFVKHGRRRLIPKRALVELLAAKVVGK
jgi:excisionase family DNA binding protein